MAFYEEDIDNKDCQLCQGKGVVEVHCGAPNDSEEDECPHCLRRNMTRDIRRLKNGRRKRKPMEQAAIQMIEIIYSDKSDEQEKEMAKTTLLDAIGKL